MVIRIWLPCIVLNCIVIPSLFAKPFSLNEAIAAEERLKGLQPTSRSKFETETAERFSLNKVAKNSPFKSKKHNIPEKPERFSFSKSLRTNPLKSKKKKVTENIFPRSKKISHIEYRQTYQIKSPLKPKKLKNILKARHRRRNQAIKREIYDDEKFGKKYIPLLKSLSLLFDNILAESDDSIEIKSAKFRKYRNTQRNKTECTCSKTDREIRNTEPTQETIIPTTPLDEVPTVEPTQLTTTEAPTTTTDYASTSDVSDIRQDTDVPLLLPRNSSSTRRDHNGDSEGSGTAFYASSEGNIARDHGNSEYHTRSREYKSNTKNHEENSDGTTREYASSTELTGGIFRDTHDTRRPVYRRGIDETETVFSTEGEDSIRKDGRDFNEFERQNYLERTDSLRYVGGDHIKSAGENKHEIGGDKAESPKSLQQFVRGDRRFIPEDSFEKNAEPIQFQEGREDGVVGVTHYIASNQRLADGDGTSAAENQKVRPANATVMSIKDLNNHISIEQNSPKHKAPFVTIIDGYSVARDKNGANKLAEQSIRFHS